MRGIVIRVAIVAIIVVGGFILRDRLSGNAGDLQVGDCFQVPTDMSRPISDVQHSPCNESHTGEVFLVRDYDLASASYPNDDDWGRFLEAYCLPAFNAYTGRDYETDTELDIGWFSPTEDGWRGGDTEVICYGVRLDDAAMTQSIKKVQ